MDAMFVDSACCGLSLADFVLTPFLGESSSHRSGDGASVMVPGSSKMSQPLRSCVAFFSRGYHHGNF